ncbi:MAG: metallophosphoesterase [Pseudomonadota bacterium]
MIRVTLEPKPVHSEPYRCAGRGVAALPFIRGRISGLGAAPGFTIVASSDLQGRALDGPGLLGEAAAQRLRRLREAGAIPRLDLCCLGGDLYAAPDAREMGASGDATEAFNAFARLAPTIGVLGNHDRIDPARLSDAVRLLDGERADVARLTIGGVGGVIGRADKPMRRPASAYLDALDAAQNADILLTHQGPDLPDRGEPGAPAIRAQLARRGAGLQLFGHARWRDPRGEIGGWSLLNLDARLYVLTVDG